ncbi:hypothetical protein DD237_004270 [Peronospora effusa]|uniref:Uncharacterized protein n=1 Tax=Peronospora effusa TaxID=542832 RepID=A0A3R7XD95_9STRA|nr:hypothetical protein DD237_004270 [Peronospora effusa]
MIQRWALDTWVRAWCLPMNPIFTTALKDNSDGNSYYGKNNLLKQLAIYSAVGVVGTLIALVIMILPYPILYVR